MNKKLWTGFVGMVVVIFLALELWSMFDGDEETQTLTATIIYNVPPDIFFIVIGAFGLWVIYHFIKYYAKNEGWKN